MHAIGSCKVQQHLLFDLDARDMGGAVDDTY